MKAEFYIPNEEHIQPQSDQNKQGRFGKLDKISLYSIKDSMEKHSKEAFYLYGDLLKSVAISNEGNVYDIGIAKELARIILPLSTYTEMYWKIDLHNLLHFLSLRASPHAQYEIRVYAEKLLEIVEKWVPETYSAFMNYRKNATTFSESEVEIIQDLIGKTSMKKPKAFSDREWKDFSEKVDLIDEHGEEDAS